jgi:hypothetical protein
MRAIAASFALLAATAAGGCQSLPALRLMPAPKPTVEGLRGTQTEAQWLHEARLATPPGCSVRTVTVLTDSEAAFTYACFGTDPLTDGL